MAPGRSEAGLDDFIFSSGRLHLLLNADVHHPAAVQKSAYRFGDRFSALIGPRREGCLPVTLVFPSTATEEKARQAALEFLRELVDQELRDRIAEETRAMRALILAHAFSKTDLVRRD